MQISKYIFILCLIACGQMFSRNVTPTKLLYSPLVKPQKFYEEYKKYPFILIDCLSHVVLLENMPHKKTYPSSMTKLMTLYLLFSAVDDGVVKLDTSVPISTTAAKKSGSKMFLKSGDSVLLSDVILGVAVCSGNDAATLIAEVLSGSEAAFASEMNYYAKKLFMVNTHFANATGWPDKEHFSTVYDLSLLGVRMLEDFPEHYGIFSQRTIKYNGILQYNYNKLIRRGIGVDGIKTGHTDVGGYGIIASAKNSFGRRLLLVINECEKESIRDKIATNLLRIGFQNFDNFLILRAGVEAIKVKVWLGESETVSAAPKRNVVLTLDKSDLDNVKASIHYTEPLTAPIKKGQVVAKLIVSNKTTKKKLSYSLYALSDVAEVSTLAKIKKILEFLIFGF